mgnify:CR=1 FL=1
MASCHIYHRQQFPKVRADVDFAKPSQGYRASVVRCLGDRQLAPRDLSHPLHIVLPR